MAASRRSRCPKMCLQVAASQCTYGVSARANESRLHTSFGARQVSGRGCSSVYAGLLLAGEKRGRRTPSQGVPQVIVKHVRSIIACPRRQITIMQRVSWSCHLSRFGRRFSARAVRGNGGAATAGTTITATGGATDHSYAMSTATSAWGLECAAETAAHGGEMRNRHQN